MRNDPRRLTVVAEGRTPHRLALSTMVVMGATLASTILGFVREVVYAKFYGTSWELDAFLAASIVPVILFGVFNGALVTALVPLFTDYVNTEREGEAWKLATTTIVLVGAILSVCAALGALLAPWYVPHIAHFPTARAVHAAVEMTRWLMPTIVATSVAGVLGALLNAYHRFGAAALQGVVANVCIIVAVWFAQPHYGAYALVFGALAGAFVSVLALLPTFFRLRRFRLALDLRHPGLIKLLHVLAPIAVGSAAGQVALFFDRFFASGLPEGTIAGMNFAVKIVGFPQQIFVTAIATVIFPLFASQFAHKNRAAMRKSVATGLQMVIFLTLPSAWGLCMLAGPIVQTLFERGAFTPVATVLCAQLLPYAAVGLVALAANVVLTRCLYACGVVRTAIGISVATVALNVILSLAFLPTLGARGLLLANAVSQTLQTIAYLGVAWRALGGFPLKTVAISLLKVGACSAIMALALAAVQVTRTPPAPTMLARVTNLGEHLLFGAFVFVALARIVDSEELHLAIDLLLRRRPRDLVPLP
ncbi:MAG TPA: murein biosynthesis integral membrane protein MurJ [Candidatus Limnocylindrales bacterium]|nr:murein biosynthesis integral membrane protein MurJ [Candidatus Limnocylindrales bacterium]